jgi:hypothetical protein
MVLKQCGPDATIVLAPASEIARSEGQGTGAEIRAIARRFLAIAAIR